MTSLAAYDGVLMAGRRHSFVISLRFGARRAAGEENFELCT